MVTKEQLINVGVDKLMDIVLSLCKVNQDFEAQLQIILGGCESDPNFNPYAVVIKKEIETLKSEEYAYFDVDGITEETKEILKDIRENISPNSPNQAIELLDSLLTCIEYIEDNGYINLHDVFRETCVDLATLHKHVGTPIKKIVEFVNTRFIEANRFSSCNFKFAHFFHDAILDFKHVLEDEGIAQLKQKIVQSFKDGNKDASKIREGLIIIAEYQNDVDAFIHAHTFTGEINAFDLCTIARKLIRHQRAKEAFAWLDAANSKHPPIYYEVPYIKIEALQACGDFREAQEQRQKYFDEMGSAVGRAKLYKEIMEHAEAGSIESWKKYAIEKIFEMKDPHDALDVLIEVQEFELAVVFIYEKIDSLRGGRNRTLREIAEKLSEIGPLAATLLYRKMIDSRIKYFKNENDFINSSVKRKKSKYYSSFKENYFCNSVKDLNACNRLSSKITDWQGYKNHKLYFEELLVKHKDVTDLWNEYTSVLKEQLAKENREPKAASK